MLDNSMYFRQKGAADLMGGLQDGMRMREMIDQRNRRKQEEETKTAFNDILKRNHTESENGQFALNRDMAFKEMVNQNPEKAMEYQKAWEAQDAQKEDRLFDKNYKKKMLALRERELGAKKTKMADALTPAQKKVDEAYGKDYNDWKAQGGLATVTRNLNDAKAVAKKLMSGGGYSGKWDGMFGGTAVQDYVNPKGAALQDQINRIVMGSLRATLGAQFTEKEGKRVLEATYNPRQSEEENARRIMGLVGELESVAKAKEASAAFYEKNGTLSGYKGPEFDTEKFQNMYATNPEKKGRGATGDWGIIGNAYANDFQPSGLDSKQRKARIQELQEKAKRGRSRMQGRQY